MTTNKLVLAVLAGAAAGLVISMLVAPEKGSEIRKKISDIAGDWIDKLVDSVAPGKTNLGGLLSQDAPDSGQLIG